MVPKRGTPFDHLIPYDTHANGSQSGSLNIPLFIKNTKNTKKAVHPKMAKTGVCIFSAQNVHITKSPHTKVLNYHCFTIP